MNTPRPRVRIPFHRLSHSIPIRKDFANHPRDRSCSLTRPWISLRLFLHAYHRLPVYDESSKTDLFLRRLPTIVYHLQHVDMRCKYHHDKNSFRDKIVALIYGKVTANGKVEDQEILDGKGNAVDTVNSENRDSLLEWHSDICWKCRDHKVLVNRADSDRSDILDRVVIAVMDNIIWRWDISPLF